MSIELEPVSPRPLALNLYAQYPSLRDRIDRAVDLYKSGAVTITSTAIEVLSASSDAVYLVKSDLSSCTCPDHEKAPFGACKHVLSSALHIAAHIELPAKKLPRIVKFLRNAR